MDVSNAAVNPRVWKGAERIGAERMGGRNTAALR